MLGVYTCSTLTHKITSTAEVYLDYYISLMGTLPPELGGLSLLKELFVGTNRLTGTIPPELNNLQTLRALRLDENYVSGTIPYLWDLCPSCVSLLFVAVMYLV